MAGSRRDRADAGPHARSVATGRVRVYIGTIIMADATTMASVIAATRGDPRVQAGGPWPRRADVHRDCLNRMYGALAEDERREGIEARMVVLHTTPNMVDPAALRLLDHALWGAHFVKLVLARRNHNRAGSALLGRIRRSAWQGAGGARCPRAGMQGAGSAARWRAARSIRPRRYARRQALRRRFADRGLRTPARLARRRARAVPACARQQRAIDPRLVPSPTRA